MAEYGAMNDDVSILHRGQDLITWFRYRSSFEKVACCIATAFMLAMPIVVIGLLIDKYDQHLAIEKCLSEKLKPFTHIKVSQDFAMQNKISKSILENFDKNTIKLHLQNLTSQYHVAGTAENLKVMDYIAETWRSYGLDKVEVEEYKVLLSYPDYQKPNTIKVFENSTAWKVLSQGLSTKLGPPEAMAEQHDERAKLWWNAYAKPGTVNGTIVYGNYCSSIDLDLVLKETKLSDFAGKILLCRYGYGWRGGKAYGAELRNASGVILYSDPKDYGPPDASQAPFPSSRYMPQTGAQRGSLLMYDGDPATPELPAKDYVFRQFNEEELRQKLILPNIPVTPVSYEVARKIFEAMKSGGGAIAPESARGGLNVTYYLTSSTVFELNVNAKTETRLVRNVFGYLYGDEEPDRLVVLSNHVDAWTYGAQDPNSGTSIHLALTEAVMKSVNSTKWRPRRTMLFCAWDAEEYGLLGSAEFVQQKRRLLEQRAVAVVNVDTALSVADTFVAKSVPLLYRAIVQATRKVPNPNEKERSQNRLTVYDTWFRDQNKENPMLPNQPDIPNMKSPGGGSDHKTFLEYVGVATCDLRYDEFNSSGGSYPLYHTMYEIDWTVENLVDPLFESGQALGRVWAELVRDLADSLVIPFSVSDYATRMEHYVQKLFTDLNATKNIEKYVENYAKVRQNLADAVSRFQNETSAFQKLVDQANSGQPIQLVQVEKLNSRLVNLEQHFITPRGLPGRPESRHVVLATSAVNSYGAVVLAGVRDSLANCLKNPDDKELRKVFNLQLSILQYSLESAIDGLKM